MTNWIEVAAAVVLEYEGLVCLPISQPFASASNPYVVIVFLAECSRYQLLIQHLLRDQRCGLIRFALFPDTTTLATACIASH